MLNHVIQFALLNRLRILCITIALVVFGSMATQSLPVDVLPDLTRPRVTILTECPGMAPEEVEREVTVRIEAAVAGSPGATTIRSDSDVSLSVVTVEFEWGSDIYKCRQIVSDGLSRINRRQWPPSVREPKLGPLSSLLGQIMIIGMWSEPQDPDAPVTNPIRMRTIAEGTIRKRLQNIRGVSQVIVMGGGLKQYQVLIDIHLMHRFDVDLTEIENAFVNANLNVNGGYIERNARDLLVRGVGRFHDISQIKKLPVRTDSERAVLVEDIATVVVGETPKRGDSSVNGRDAVVLTIQKQPSVDTRELSDKLIVAIDELRPGLPADIRLEATYQQRVFIDHAVGNVVEALVIGAILVVIILFLFLLSARTTFITLTAIPVSVLVTAIVFWMFDLSINVMTLGGLAVALGELVDDAIVDVENIFRRLKQNRRLASPRPALKVIFEASVEVRNAIVMSTVLVIIVFAPLFALSGISGRLFAPLGIAYIISIVASTVVSLTLTPVLSWYLLGRAPGESAGTDRSGQESALVKLLNRLIEPLIRTSLNRERLTQLLVFASAAIILCGMYVYGMGKSFLPKFDEGATQLNLIAEPGTSLNSSRTISRFADEILLSMLRSPENPDGPIEYFTRKTGRAEDDEHVMGVNTSEIIISLNENAGASSRLVESGIENEVERLTSVTTETEQPVAHLISHMISGTTAEIAIKLFGDESIVLRGKAAEIRDAISTIPGIKPPVVEAAQPIPQLQIIPDYDQLARYKLSAAKVFQVVETAMQGKLVSQMNENELSFDIVIRFPDRFRKDFQQLERLPVELPDGGVIPLAAIATIKQTTGPNTIRRENNRRRIVIRVNTDSADLESTVKEIERRIHSNVRLDEGYYVSIGGLYEAQKSATRRILLLGAVALFLVLVILYSTYNSTVIAAQVLFSIPLAFVGGVCALALTGQLMTVAAMVGFISLGGIAARNGLLLVSTYRDLDEQHGGLTPELIVRGSLERMTPVLMTALTTGIALLPLILGGYLPGREILFPVATVIAGGLITSTVCEFLIRPGLFYFYANQNSGLRSSGGIESGSGFSNSNANGPGDVGNLFGRGAAGDETQQ